MSNENNNIKILIVEDDKSVVNLIDITLETPNYSRLIAYTVKEAL